MSMTYGIYLYDKVAGLDFAGPHETFGISCMLQGGGRVVTVAASDKPIRCATGLTVLPDHTFESAPEIDVLLIPGAESLDAALADGAALEWIRSAADKARFTTAVCTGALILNAAGLLQGRKATTHHLLIPELEKADGVTVLPDMRFVRDGNVVTSQGVSAGIDMALWLVGELYSPDHARAVRRILQYDPAPPYAYEA